MNVFGGILIPFIGTCLGASLVFFMRNSLNKKLEKALLGFASGVMIAASIWSLILPSISMSESSSLPSWVPATTGFLLGIFLLMLIDAISSNIYKDSSDLLDENKKSKMLFFAVTLHNIPEGMAVGVAFAGFLSGNAGITIASALALSFGIAIQNFPEGAIISMPLKSTGYSKLKSFLYGVASAIVEPIGALLTILLTSIVVPVLPYLLSFAAGAMIYVVTEELIPEAQTGKHSSLATIGLSLGFSVMMILDVALG